MRKLAFHWLPSLAATVLLAAFLHPTRGAAADAGAPASKSLSSSTANWARDPGFRELKLSPDGKHLAARIHDVDGAGVVVLSLPGLKPVGGLRLEPGKGLADFIWSSDEYLVAELATEVGPIESAAATGELVSFRYDGRDRKYIIGHERTGASNYRAVWATLVDPLRDDPNHVLVVTGRYDKARAELSLQRLNIHTSQLYELAMAPIYGDTTFVLDAQRQVRYVHVVPDGATFTQQTWKRESDGQWTALKNVAGVDAKPIALSVDGKALYRITSRDQGPWCMDRVELATDAVEVLACDARAAVLGPIWSFDGSLEPIAAVLEPGRSETRIFPTGHPHRELLKLATDAFPGKQVLVESTAQNGRLVLLLVSDDRSPGDWYLFNTVDKKIDYLLGRQEWLDPEWMGERRPLALKARDGTPLQAYLTLPPGREAKSLPLVVWPHGGPFWVRDGWTFDREPQLLATHGYAVLQVNFRGSDGHGPGFVNAGKRAWGTTMIDDLTDAVRATIASGVVDGSRICIGGWSYGGYAALMSAVREPDLYRCVIGAAGIYDLNKHLKDSDTGDSWQGRRYLADAVAPDAESRRAASPIERLSALKAPVLIIHGGEDRRVTVGQARLLRAALEKKQHPHEVLIIDQEGHGFRKEANVQRYFDTLLAFLDRYLAPTATAAETAAETTAAR